MLYKHNTTLLLIQLLKVLGTNNNMMYLQTSTYIKFLLIYILVTSNNATSTPTSNNNTNEGNPSSKRDHTNDHLNPALNTLLEGFDCKDPKDLESFELENVEECEDRLQQASKVPAHMQILQHSDNYRIKALICQLTRTTKFSYCGTSDHSVPLFSKEQTYQKVNLPHRRCRIIHRDKEVWKGDKRIKLELNQEVVNAMYTKGKQYPYEGWDGNQIKCDGKNTMIDDIRTPHTIQYEEDTWLIEETELLAGKDHLMDFNKKKKSSKLQGR